MEYVLNNNVDLCKLKEMFDTMSMENNNDATIEDVEEEEEESSHSDNELDDEIIPESFSINDYNYDIIPEELIKKKIMKEILKNEYRDKLLINYFKEESFYPDVVEKYDEIKKKIYYFFYKLLNSDEWEELLYEKFMEHEMTKDLFLCHFTRKGLIVSSLLENEIYNTYKEITLSLINEIEL